MELRLVQPKWEGSNALDYFTDEEYEGGYDLVTLIPHQETVQIKATLYYQTTSKEYIQFLRDEINGDNPTLPEEAYIAQTDPFFENLKGWGDAIWDLWLHNNGANPIEMTSLNIEFETEPEPEPESEPESDEKPWIPGFPMEAISIAIALILLLDLNSNRNFTRFN